MKFRARGTRVEGPSPAPSCLCLENVLFFKLFIVSLAYGVTRLMKKYYPIFVISLIVLSAVIGVLLFQANRTYEYDGQQYRAGESFRDIEGCNTCSFDANGQLQCTLLACYPDGLPPEDTVDIKLNYKAGAYIYKGTLQKPTPCHEVESEVVVRESFPEQVDLRFTVKDSGQSCIQVIEEAVVTGEIRVSKEASIRVFVNNKIQTEHVIIE